MTDEQIIIDGVNVKDCKRRIGKYNFCRYYKRPCAENNYNCIWKKYLRKEQECEELKKTVMYKCPQCGEEYLSPIGASLYEENNNLKEKKAKYYQQTSKIYKHEL